LIKSRTKHDKIRRKTTLLFQYFEAWKLGGLPLK